MPARGENHAKSEEQLNLDTRQRRELAPALLLGGLIVIAIALRFWRLGDWNFQGTEMFTLRDSVKPQFGNTRPLGYLLNYYLVRPFLPLDEFGLRLLPAVFGVLAIPAFYLLSRHLLNARAALMGTLLLTFSPLHVMYSQLARYWSLVFLLSAIYPYALYIGVRERNRRMLVLGLVTGILAALAHPAAILLLGGPALLLVAQLRRQQLARLWSQNAVRWTGLFLILLAAVIAWRFIPIFQGWISQHDKNPGSGAFLIPSFRPGLKQLFYVAAFLESLTLPLTLTGLVGVYLVWRDRDRSLGLFLTSLAVFPVAFLTLISLRTPVSLYYLLPVAPVFFLGAGAFLDRLLEVDWGLRPRWLLPATVLAVILLAGMPILISDYLNGRRYDFRQMAQWLQPRLAPADIVFSDQPMVLAHYLPGTQVRKLRLNTAPLMESVRLLDHSGGGAVLWIVAPAPAHAFRTNLKEGGLARWLYANCQLRNSVGVGRIDIRHQYLQIYRCAPAARSELGANSE